MVVERSAPQTVNSSAPTPVHRPGMAPERREVRRHTTADGGELRCDAGRAEAYRKRPKTAPDQVSNGTQAGDGGPFDVAVHACDTRGQCGGVPGPALPLVG